VLLSGKVALVTGGSKGLGKAITLAYAREGAAVVACSRNPVNLREVERELSAVTCSYLLLPVDVGKPDQVRKLVDDSMARFKRIDILVNNASVLGPRVEVVKYPEDEWRTIVEVNLFGAYLVSKRVSQVMIDQRSGSIINVTSSVGRRGRARWGAYAAAKFGLEGLTQVLADELRLYNIRVNSVNPGALATEMRRAAYPDEDQSKLKKPDETMDVYLYLASDESLGKTGGAYDAQDFVKPQ
jgi:NAD(P)-dependent dehydrogenase (short-subunit alcohol dehydrogenase family)